MLTAIRNWVIRTMMKAKGQTGVVQTIPRRDLIEINTQVTAQKLMQNGIDPEALKNADQVENAIIAIESRPKVQEGIKSTKSAKIFNTAGEELDPNQPIIGGTQPGKKIDTDAFIRNAEAQELETKIQKKLEKGNKEAAQRIRKRQKMVEDAIDNMSPSLSGDTRTDAALVAEDMAESMGKVYDDLSTKERLDLYDQAYTGLSKIRFKGFKKPKDADDPNYDAEPADFDPDADNETFAQGGRAGFKEGEGIMMAGSLGDEKDDISREIFGKPVKDLNPDELQELMEELERLREKFRAAQGGRAGFFMGSANPKGLGLLRDLLKFFGKKSEVIKNPSDPLRVTNPKLFNKMLEDAKGKVIPKQGIMATDQVRDYQTQMAKERIDVVNEMLEKGKRMKGADDRILAYKNDVKNRFMRELNLSEKEAEKAADRMTTLFMDMSKMPKTPRITDEGILQLENVLKNMETGGKKARDLNADGGRIGFKDGMTRRTFLKLLGGLASIPIIGKIVKPIKLSTGVKKVPLIKTDDVAGKPEWFDTLVNKVIIEGDDVTKKFATAERQSIHQKTLDDGSVVRVTEDIDDGAVRVEYESQESMFGEPVQLQYKKPLPDEGDPRPAAEFEVSESGFVSRSDGPDDYVLEGEAMTGSNIRELESDVSKLKQYATGKGPTMKEIVEIKKRKDKVRRLNEGDPGETSQYVSDRQPEPDIDYGGDFASGGIARMLGE